MIDYHDSDYHPEAVGALTACALLALLGGFFGWLCWLTLIAR